MSVQCIKTGSVFKMVTINIFILLNTIASGISTTLNMKLLWPQMSFVFCSITHTDTHTEKTHHQQQPKSPSVFELALDFPDFL